MFEDLDNLAERAVQHVAKKPRENTVQWLKRTHQVPLIHRIAEGPGIAKYSIKHTDDNYRYLEIVDGGKPAPFKFRMPV